MKFVVTNHKTNF